MEEIFLTQSQSTRQKISLFSEMPHIWTCQSSKWYKTMGIEMACIIAQYETSPGRASRSTFAVKPGREPFT